LKFVRLILTFVLALTQLRAATAFGETARPYPQGPAFPLEVYEVRPEEVPALAACGWNIFQTYGIANTSGYDVYLTHLAADGAGAMAAIGSYGSKTNRTEWPAAKAQSWIRAIAAHGNVAWWDLPEEMRPWSPRELKVLTDYTAWTRAGDPARRPTYEYTPNNRNAAELARIVPNVDILGVSCYCEEMRMPHAWVRYKIQETGLHGIALAGATVGADYLRGQKIPVAILFCAKDAKTGLMPVSDQTYHDFWSAIVSGAQGIGVYAYHHAMRDDPSLARNFKRLSEAATQISGPEKLGDVILRGETCPTVVAEILSGPEKTVSFRPPTEKVDFQYSSLNLLAKAKDGIEWVIAVNSTDQPVTARVSGLPPIGNRVTVPFENRTLAFASGSLTDRLEPWGVHIYKIALMGDNSEASAHH
jgi:hypothetical protein